MAHWYGRATGWLIRHQKRIKTIGIGLFLYLCINFVYDYLFYPFAIFHWGIVVGGSIAAAGSLIQNTTMFWLYDRMRIDWLGAYALEQLKDKGNKTRLERMAVWVGSEKKTLWGKVSSFFLFAFLTVAIDPLIVAVHFKRRHFEGLEARDWGILLSAVVLANAWWIARTAFGVTVFLVMWHFFF
jgi:hypothetical protein